MIVPSKIPIAIRSKEASNKPERGKFGYPWVAMCTQATVIMQKAEEMLTFRWMTISWLWQFWLQYAVPILNWYA